MMPAATVAPTIRVAIWKSFSFAATIAIGVAILLLTWIVMLLVLVSYSKIFVLTTRLLLCQQKVNIAKVILFNCTGRIRRYAVAKNTRSANGRGSCCGAVFCLFSSGGRSM
jgi:hypothetical protein